MDLSHLVCSECGRAPGLLMRCGYDGPPEAVGCRRVICSNCVAGYWRPEGTTLQRPLCKYCAPKWGGRREVKG